MYVLCCYNVHRFLLLLGAILLQIYKIIVLAPNVDIFLKLFLVGGAACEQQRNNTTNKLLLTTVDIDCIEYWNFYSN